MEICQVRPESLVGFVIGCRRSEGACVGVGKRITVCKNVCVCGCRAAYNKRRHLHKLHGAQRGCSEENNKEEKKDKSYVVWAERESESSRIEERVEMNRERLEAAPLW